MLEWESQQGWWEGGNRSEAAPRLTGRRATSPIKYSFLQDLFLRMQGAVKVFYKHPFSMNFSYFSLGGSKILSEVCWGDFTPPDSCLAAGSFLWASCSVALVAVSHCSSPMTQRNRKEIPWWTKSATTKQVPVFWSSRGQTTSFWISS